MTGSFPVSPEVTYVPIGVIRSAHTKPEETPIQPIYAQGCTGWAEVFPEYAEGLRELEGFSHVYLIYHLHRAGPAKLVVKPFLDDAERGMFATRAPCRPNPIGLSVVKLVRREGNVLHLDGLDVLDGSPLLDIKPYIARFDRVEGTRNGWQDAVDEETANLRGRRGYRPAAPTGDHDLAETIRFHGHLCAGLAIGYRAATEALTRLGTARAEDEEMIAIVENDSCSVDAVQWLTGCTFGKGNLFFRDHGKQVLTLALRPSGRAVRIALKRLDRRQGEPQLQDREARTRWLLDAPVEYLFDVRETVIPLPREAEIRESTVCDWCGEEAMASRMVKDGSRTLCIPCAKDGR